MPDPIDRPRKIGWLEAWNRSYLRFPSVIILVGANLVPLYGVLFWDWDLFVLMTAYWLETAVIGFWTIIHMAMLARWASLFYVPFFIVHFGGFMAGHFLFLWTMFAGDRMNSEVDLTGFGDLLNAILFGKGLWLALAALFISHGLSFYFNVLRPYMRGEGEKPEQAQAVMMAPYGRIFVMHVTILFGAALAAYFNTKTAAFVLLIALKIFVDVSAHIRKNFKPADAVPQRAKLV